MALERTGKLETPARYCGRPQGGGCLEESRVTFEVLSLCDKKW